MPRLGQRAPPVVLVIMDKDNDKDGGGGAQGLRPAGTAASSPVGGAGGGGQGATSHSEKVCFAGGEGGRPRRGEEDFEPLIVGVQGI